MAIDQERTDMSDKEYVIAIMDESKTYLDVKKLLHERNYPEHETYVVVFTSPPSNPWAQSFTTLKEMLKNLGEEGQTQPISSLPLPFPSPQSIVKLMCKHHHLHRYKVRKLPTKCKEEGCNQFVSKNSSYPRP